MKQICLILLCSFVAKFTLLAQSYQPLENQRLSTTNEVSFKKVTVNGVIGGPDYSFTVNGLTNLNGFCTFNDDTKFLYYIQVAGEFYHEKNLQFINKAHSAWIPWASINTTGTENVIDLNNVGSAIINKNLAIGTSNPGTYKLAVEGKIGAREIKVTLENPWADYVFRRDYRLMNLDTLDKYIQLNNHLPNIPSAEEVKQNGGVDLGAMNIKILEKVEELTLYVIQLKKENDELKKENEEIKKKIEELQINKP